MNSLKYATKLNPAFVKRMMKQPVPWGPLGYVTYKRTYSRKRDDLGRTEEWGETVERCLNAILRYGGRFTVEEIERLYELIYTLKCTPPGRMLWQLGTSTMDRVGGDSAVNCWFVSPNEPEAFCFTFDELMLGGGVGFSVMPGDVYKLPKVKGPLSITRRDGNDVDFIIPDNREGWVELLRRVLHAYFVTGRSFSYSTHCVRGKGERIKGFGGVASGPGELVKGVNQISGVFNERVGQQLRPIDVLDIMNIIGSVVVSGNVRRSAMIALGSAKDLDYLTAKQWSKGVPNWRAMSNNSVLRSSVERLPEEFWLGYRGEGEPYGLVNLDLMRKKGRLRDADHYRPDTLVQGCNPCAEISLEPFECCDLGELFLPRFDSVREWGEAATLLYRVCKTVLQMKFSWPQTQEVLRRNQRIGVSVTGVCQVDYKAEDYDAVYRLLEAEDRRYSAEIRANTSVKLTTAKPSGSVSLLPGVTPGVHPAYSRFYTRRIRFAANDPIIEVCRKNGYPVESQIGFDGTPDHDTQIVSFPVDAGENTITASQMTATEQMDVQEFIQTHWADNSVSVTVYYRDEELPAVKEKLKAGYRERVKTISFLRHNAHGFAQAPYEEISESQYREDAAKVKPITSLTEAQQWDIVDSGECATGCPVR